MMSHPVVETGFARWSKIASSFPTALLTHGLLSDRMVRGCPSRRTLLPLYPSIMASDSRMLMAQIFFS